MSSWFFILLLFKFAYAFDFGSLFKWWQPTSSPVQQPPVIVTQEDIHLRKLRLQSKIFESVLREKYLCEKKIGSINEAVNSTTNLTNFTKTKIIEPLSLQSGHWKLLEKLSWLGIKSLDTSLNSSVTFLDISSNLFKNDLNSTNVKTEVESNYNGYLNTLSSELLIFLSEFQNIIVDMKLSSQQIQDLIDKKKKTNSTIEPIEKTPGTGSKIVDNILENVSEIADKIEESKENPFKDFHSSKNLQLETVLKLDDKDETDHHMSKNRTALKATRDPTRTLVDVNNNQYVLMKPADLTVVYEDVKLVQEIIFLICISFVSGILFEIVGLPAFFGYILVGIWLGPTGINFIKNLIQIGSLSQFGVYLLLFLLGLEFSFDKIIRVWKIAIFGTSFYALLISTFITAIGVFFTAGISESIIVGFAISLSSTAISLKCLGLEGSKKSYGHSMIAILIVQDLLLCLFLAIFPSLNQPESQIFKLISLVVLKILVLISSCIILHFIFIRFFLKLLTNFEEMYTVGILCYCLSIAQLSDYIGISMELGCFIAGIFIGIQKTFVHKTIKRMRPIADMFAILFFNSIGLHVSPQLLVGEADVLILLSLIVVLLKFFSLFLILLLIFRYGVKKSAVVSLGLSHISEFSFVIASKAKADGFISREIYYLIVGMTSISLVLVPFLWKIFYFLNWAFSKTSIYSEIDELHELKTADLENYALYGKSSSSSAVKETIFDEELTHIE